MNHDKMKKAMGIEIASCENCAYCGSESDGNYPEFSVSWAVCRKHERMENLKGFPFKSDVKCWEPEFWVSKFAKQIKSASDEDVTEQISLFVAERDRVLSE